MMEESDTNKSSMAKFPSATTLGQWGDLRMLKELFGLPRDDLTSFMGAMSTTNPDGKVLATVLGGGWPSFSGRGVAPQHCAVTPQPDFHMPGDDRVRSSKCNRIGAIVLSNDKTSDPVGHCSRRRGFGARLLRTRPSEIERAKDDDCSDKCCGSQ